MRFKLALALAALTVLFLAALLADTDGIASQPDDPVTIARLHLQRQREQAGRPSALDDLVLVETKESLGAHHVRFRQTIGGIPVAGGFTTVSVSKRTGQVGITFDRSRPGPPAVRTAPAVGREEALAAARATVGLVRAAAAERAELVYAPVEKRYELAWQVLLPALEPLGDWLVMVRAADGQVLDQRNLLQFDTGQVFDPNPVVTSGGAVPPPADCDSAGEAAALAPQYRTKTLLGIQSGQNRLKGQYVDLTAPGIAGAYKPAGQANEPSRVYNYPCNDDRFEEVTVYHAIDSAQRKIQSLGFTGRSAIRNKPIPVHAHFFDECNGFYFTSTASLYLGDSSSLSCTTTADIAEDADFVLHEYGHAVQHDQVPFFGAGTQAEFEEGAAVGEGFADFFAASLTGDPCWSEWASNGEAACQGGLGSRTLLNDNVYPADFLACDREPHCAGEIWGGALWDLVQILGNDQAARDLVLTLVLDSHFYLDATTTFTDAAAAVRQADIDLFGGAHVATIESIFAARGLLPGPIADEAYFYLRIRHSYRSDLVAYIAVGDPGLVECYFFVFVRAGGDGDDIEFSAPLDETTCGAYLPPSPARPWRLVVWDEAAPDEGYIDDFKISLLGARQCIATDVPVPIPDYNGTIRPVQSRITCDAVREPRATPTRTPTTAGPTRTPTRTRTPTATRTPSATPTPKSGTDLVAAVELGGSHSCLLTTDAGVKCWGTNVYGQLGNGTKAHNLRPADVPGLTDGMTFLNAGLSHSCALNSGDAKCWGHNDNGQVGDGTTADRTLPANVSGLAASLASIAAGGRHTCGVTVAGGAVCWGDNEFGQLGDGTATDRSMPVAVAGLGNDITAVASGGLHSCALIMTGGVKCWGNNEFGQLGDVTTTDRDTPVSVAGLSSGVAALTAGNYHTCALTSAGGVKCWGANEVGQLGDGTANNRSAPVDVAGLTTGVALPKSPLRATLAAGGRFTCAVTVTGGAKCWGRNAFGQLGDGRACGENCPAPVDVFGLGNGVGAVAAGNVHTCALTTGQALKCWGGNGAGQVGDGTTTERTTPVDVVVKREPPPATATATATPTPTDTATLTPTATASATPTKQPAPGDTDRDGCADVQENGDNESAGGRRNYLVFWDFFDVPAGNPLARDRRVTTGDITSIVTRFGSTGDADADPLSPPGAPPAYHPAFDRTPSRSDEPWDTQPPDGRVTVTDITLLVAQFGHTCAF